MKTKILEKQHVENPVVNWARARGIRATKNNGMGQRSWPDRTFWIPATGESDAHVVLMEFKVPGKKPTPLQEQTIMWLRDAGFTVEVHDNKEDAIESLRRRVG